MRTLGNFALTLIAGFAFAAFVALFIIKLLLPGALGPYAVFIAAFVAYVLTRLDWRARRGA